MINKINYIQKRLEINRVLRPNMEALFLIF